MVELAQVGELMRGHVVDQMRRQHHQAPVEEYSPVGAAAAPTGLRVGETDARNVKTERACQLSDALAEELPCPRPHQIERPLDWMRARAREFFCERVAKLAGPLGLHVSSVGLSDAQTRWGSCGSNGRILLNWRLMMLAPHLIDYVAAHELAHLRELNHSPRFWDIVALLYPDHRAARGELNSRAPTLPDL